MKLRLFPTDLRGSITPPPSKSQAHRLLIAAALAGGESALSSLALSQDISATLACMEELGASSRWEEGVLHLTGMGANAMSPNRRLAHPRLDCGESGSTLRFLIPVALAVRGGASFTGRGRLMERPQQPYFDLFDQKGIAYQLKDGVLTVSGRLPPGEYALRGDVSSQFITGLLYALPLLEGDSVIRLTTPLESRDYVTMTLDALEKFGVTAVQEDERTFRVPGNQTYRPRDLAVEADWSQAGFWYAAQGMGHPISITGMNENSLQGDKAVAQVAALLAQPCETRTVSVADIPDLVPPLAALAALCEGTTLLSDGARLRIKESDRLAAVTDVLSALGADVTEREDSLTIVGSPRLSGGVTVDAHNDHRIAMMTAIAATRCAAPVVLTGAESVNKSYPAFWDDYARLGGRFEEVF